MSGTQKTPTPGPLNVDIGFCGESIGIAFTAWPDTYTYSFYRLMSPLVRRCLAAAGIKFASDFGGIIRPEFCAFTVQVPARQEAFRAILQMAEEFGICGSLELAYWDSAEEYWRTVYPSRDAQPFDRFLTDEHRQAAARECEEIRRKLNEVLARAEQEGHNE